MTVHWNSRRGFTDGLNTASSAAKAAPAPKVDAAALAEFRLAMRKAPNARAALVNRGRKLLADPKYPSREVLRKVATLLARHWAGRQGG